MSLQKLAKELHNITLADPASAVDEDLKIGSQIVKDTNSIRQVKKLKPLTCFQKILNLKIFRPSPTSIDPTGTQSQTVLVRKILSVPNL